MTAYFVRSAKPQPSRVTDPTANNYWLPIKGEAASEPSFIQTLGLGARMRIEQARTFNELNTTDWWLDHFMKQTSVQLLDTIERLELRPRGWGESGPKSRLAGILADHFRKMVQ